MGDSGRWPITSPLAWVVPPTHFVETHQLPAAHVGGEAAHTGGAPGLLARVVRELVGLVVDAAQQLGQQADDEQICRVGRVSVRIAGWMAGPDQVPSSTCRRHLRGRDGNPESQGREAHVWANGRHAPVKKPAPATTTLLMCHQTLCISSIAYTNIHECEDSPTIFPERDGNRDQPPKASSRCGLQRA